MASATVILLKQQLAALDAQINTMLAQPVLLDHGVDGQSFQENANLDRMLERKEKLLVLLRKCQPYELLTRTLLT